MSFLKSKKALRNPYKIIPYLHSKFNFKWVPKKIYLKMLYRANLGKKLNLSNPRTFNEKLQWLKLYWYNPLATKCADKYEVRKYVKDKIGKEYLNDIYSVYNSIEDINLNKLPNSFVLKGTHASGYNIVCKDKEHMEWDEEFKKMKEWLKSDYYSKKFEWVYKDIKPRIICERYIEQDDGAELRDYRFFCFNGEPKFVTVDFSINNKKETRRNLYDLEWNLMDEEISYPKELKIKVDKPKKLDEMLELSRKLSSEFPHARIDFYYIKEQIIFGEITFFHQSGLGIFKPAEFEETMGSWLQLPNNK